MNKKQKKTMLLLLAAVIALVAILLIAVAVKDHKAKQADAAAASSAAAMTDSSVDYTSLTYNNGTATLTFAKDDSGVWTWSDDPGFPLDDTYLTQLSNTIAGLSPQQTITDGDTLDAYGLDAPSMTLTADAADGTETSLQLGNAVAGGSGSYYLLMNGDDKTVYVIDGTLHDELSRGIYDMMTLPDLPVLTEDRITSLTVQGTAETVLTPTVTQPSASAASSAASSSESAASVTWRSGGADVTDESDVVSLVSEVQTMSIAACKDYKPSAQAVSLCGFDTPRAVLTMNYTDDKGNAQTLILTVGGATTDGDGSYVRVNDDSTIYSMNSDGIKTLLQIAASSLSAD